MNQRDILKNIVKFGRKEFSEKRPLNLQVLRVKSKSILKRGLLPNLNIKQIQGIFFLVVLDYNEHLRIYFFNRNGELTGGENFEKSSVLMKKLTKETTLEYKLPKLKLTLTISDITSYYRNQFDKILQHMNSTFGMNVKLPVIIAHKGLNLQIGRTIGCVLDKGKNTLLISPEAYKNEIFEIIAVREIIYLYLKNTIFLFHEKEKELTYWYDLAILFTNFYLKNAKNALITNLIENSPKSYLVLGDDEKYDLSNQVLAILKNNKKIYTNNQVNIIFKNIFNSLKILKENGINLQPREFLTLFFELCNIFSEKSNIFHQSLSKTNYYEFLAILFSKNLSKNKTSNKSKFLALVFNILSGVSIKIKTLSELLKEIKNLSKNKNVQEEIKKLKNLTEKALTEFILTEFIDISIEHKLFINCIELWINIKNNADYVFQDFEYKLKWKPKNRLNQLSVENIKKSRDLHDNFRRKYSFTIESKGTISIFITITFLNPIGKNHLKKVIKLDKISL